MIPPTWMIEELKRLRRERAEQERLRIQIEVELPVRGVRPDPERRPAGPIVIDL